MLKARFANFLQELYAKKDDEDFKILEDFRIKLFDCLINYDITVIIKHPV